jgi:hypothetical protein
MLIEWLASLPTAHERLKSGIHEECRTVRPQKFAL